LAIADEEEIEDVLSMQESYVDLPRLSATKRKSMQIFKSPPKKKMTNPGVSEATPTNVAPWMQSPWLSVASTQQ
jgi:hypothetical protein